MVGLVGVFGYLDDSSGKDKR